jgi:regulator of sigma E protease
LWVLIDGIVFNFILAIVLFFISGLIYGKPVNEPIVKETVEGKAAYLAGIEAGDRIISINGVSINTWDDFLLEVSAKKLKDNYEFVVKKSSGEIKNYNIVPEVIKNEKGEETRVFGIVSNGTVYKKGLLNAISYAFVGTYENSVTIFKIIASLFTGQVSVKSLSGPVGIYSIVDQVKSQGFITLLYLTAYLSINVGIVNLIPIPVFDGGRVLLLIIEAITKKKYPKLESILNYVGFGLMILLMLIVTFNDILKLF